MHGLFFFFIQKFAESCALTVPADAAHAIRAQIERSAKYLPDGTCPDAEASGLLESVSESLGKPCEQTYAQFGEYVAPHLIRVAAPLIDPSWRTLDIVEHTDDLILSMVQGQRLAGYPPTHETVRIGPSELHLVYCSPRKMCTVAAGVVRGVARHFGENVSIEESACMLRGSPFCSFVVRCVGPDRGAPPSSATKTTAAHHAVASSPENHTSVDPGLASDTEGGDSVPSWIGPYRVLDLIAEGAMGRVYHARDDQLDRTVAIKVMLPSRANDPGARERFIREGRAAASITHPHVLTVYGVGEDQGRPYIVMQHLDGVPLSACQLPLPVSEALRIGREIASGLMAAHECEVIHRDIKPSNIFLVGPERRVQIIDFGLARGTTECVPTITTESVVVGTPAYMSPERLVDDPLNARTDLFGLGVVLYQLMAGRLPYEGDSILSMLTSIARGQPLPLSQAAPGVPPEVCDLVMRLMAHRQEDRPIDARSAEAELAALEKRIGRVSVGS